MEATPERDERVMKIVEEARRQSPAERESFLRQACETDSNLHQEIAETLEWEERMGGFLQQPLIALTLVARPFEAGQVIEGRFEVVRVIGEGGMGIVYEAIDRKRNQRIAIKSAKPGFQRLLSPELEGALKVRHPNICLVNQIHTTKTDHGEVDFLSMEFLEGETLSARLAKEGKLDPTLALDIARQLCAGLSEAHRSGIVHGDLKGSNIILCHNDDESLRPVITDFGLASGANQAPGEFGGTPAYMAPELWRGEKPSCASDIYALGVILYEIVTGRPPFASKSIETRVTRPPLPSTLTKGLDPRWDRVILDCVAELPSARPYNAAQVIARLEKRPFRKAPFIALALIAIAALTPPVRERVIDIFMPAHMRLAILPFQGPKDATVISEGALQDVSDRLRHLPSARRTLVVIPTPEDLKNSVQTPEQAGKVLHATHALQTSVRREGEDYIAEGSVVNLATQVHLRDFSARYSLATIGALPSALAGEISLALRLHSAAVPETLSPEATTPYDRGLYLLRTDRHTFEDAIVLFKEAARLDPRSPLPPAALVEAQIAKFELTKEHACLEEAQRALREAESLNPDSARVRFAAGLLNETAGHHEKALEDYRRVQELEPRNIDALVHVAITYDELNIPEKAIENYEKAIALDPGYFAPYEELGEFYFNRGKYLEAAEQFQKSIDRAPGVVYTHTNLGAALSELGRYAEAKQALHDSLKLKETARAWNSLGATQAYQSQETDAVVSFENAVRLDARDYVYVQNLADSYRRLGRTTGAKTAYRNAADLTQEELNENPSLGYSRAYLAYAIARLGDRKRAETEIRQALQLSPGNNRVLRKAVLTYEVLGQRDRAIAVLREATAEVIQELDREPDMKEFRQDLRFRQLANNTATGGK